MTSLTDVRLTVIGPQESLERFNRSNWEQRLKAKHIDVWEHSKTRRVWWFQTVSSLQHRDLAYLSLRSPNLVFLLDYEDQRERVKGLIRARRGNIDQCQFSF